MDKVSVYDAKARFSELIERAESGRSTVITKRGRVVAKVVPAKSVLFLRHVLTSPADIPKHAAADIPALEELARKHGYQVAGPIENAYWNMAIPGIPHILEVRLPVVKADRPGVQEYKEVAAFTCVSVHFRASLDDIGEAWGALGEAAAKQSKPNAESREVYLHLDDADPSKNDVELQMGVE